MKIKLITLTTLGALSLGSSAFAQEPTTAAQDHQGGRGRSHHNSLQRATEQLNLTPNRRQKSNRSSTRTTPQIENIRREAMQKTKAVMDNAMAQIRPLLTPSSRRSSTTRKMIAVGDTEAAVGTAAGTDNATRTIPIPITVRRIFPPRR
jgi:hypothetical protein